MGVPGFFPWLMKVAPNCLKNTIPEGVNVLMIDGNGELHVNFTDNFKIVGEVETKESYHGRFKENCNNFSAKFMQRITGLVSTFKPDIGFVLAIDGICPLAKMHQQKSRRYTSESTPKKFSSSRSVFCDKNSLTPGTMVMEKHHSNLLNFFSNNRQYFPAEFLYSSYLEYGEAEHKIFDLLRTGAYRSRRTVIYADDADVIVNSLIAPVESLFIARSQKEIYHSVNIIDIAEARKAIVRLMLHSDGSTNPFCLFDFIFLTLFLGNDFLPASMMLTGVFHTESVSIGKRGMMPFDLSNYDGSLNFVLEVYRRLNLNLIGQNYSINFEEVTRFLDGIQKFESSLILFNLNNSVLPIKLAQKSILNKRPQLLGLSPDIDHSFEYLLLSDHDDVLALFSIEDVKRSYRGNMSLRTLHYNSIFSMYESSALQAFENLPNVDDVDISGLNPVQKSLIKLAAADGGPYPGKIYSMAESYLTTLIWIYYYYVSGIDSLKNCDVYYPHPIAPMILDIQEMLSVRPNFLQNVKDVLLETRQFSTRKYMPHHHALSVLPIWSRDSVPKQLEAFMSIIGVFADYYPIKFIVFQNNMRVLEDKHAFLPPIPVERILKSLPAKLVKYEATRQVKDLRIGIRMIPDPQAALIYSFQTQRRKYVPKEQEKKTTTTTSSGIIRRWL